MEKKSLTFTFDPTDFDAMRQLMDEHGNSDTMFLGVNTELEDTTISILPEKIVYVTYQRNGWVRKNIYWHDGTREEMFDGSWKTRSDKRPKGVCV